MNHQEQRAQPSVLAQIVDRNIQTLLQRLGGKQVCLNRTAVLS